LPKKWSNQQYFISPKLKNKCIPLNWRPPPSPSPISYYAANQEALFTERFAVAALAAAAAVRPTLNDVFWPVTALRRKFRCPTTKPMMRIGFQVRPLSELCNHTTTTNAAV
jgi:hypothetical protein